MKHKRYEKLLQLSFYNELSEQEQRQLELHVGGCSECQAEQKALLNFHSMLSDPSAVGKFEVSEQLLSEMRRELHATLLQQNETIPIWERLIEKLDAVVTPRYRMAAMSFAMLAVGVLAGYLVFSHPEENKNYTEVTTVAGASFDRGDTRTSNIRLVDAGGKNGEVEFDFDAVTPVHVKGNLSDERVQKIMARALVNEDNPGVRLRTVNALASQTETSQATDPAIKAALITALKIDDNVAVRKEALRALVQLPFDNEIKDAILYALVHDTNAGIRIAAINSLELTKYESRMQDSDIVKVLKEKMHSDDNNYIRYQAKTALQEVSNQ